MPTHNVGMTALVEALLHQANYVPWPPTSIKAKCADQDHSCGHVVTASWPLLPRWVHSGGQGNRIWGWRGPFCLNLMRSFPLSSPWLFKWKQLAEKPHAINKEQPTKSLKISEMFNKHLQSEKINNIAEEPAAPFSPSCYWGSGSM